MLSIISKKTKYALKALIYLAQYYETQNPILISELAVQQKIPKKFLELILLELKNKGFLQSKKGKGGGYRLAQKPDKIYVGPIIRALEGVLAPLPCLSENTSQKCEECMDQNSCAIR